MSDGFPQEVIMDEQGEARVSIMSDKKEEKLLSKESIVIKAERRCFEVN